MNKSIRFSFKILVEKGEIYVDRKQPPPKKYANKSPQFSFKLLVEKKGKLTVKETKNKKYANENIYDYHLKGFFFYLFF